MKEITLNEFEMYPGMNTIVLSGDDMQDVGEGSFLLLKSTGDEEREVQVYRATVLNMEDATDQKTLRRFLPTHHLQRVRMDIDSFSEVMDLQYPGGWGPEILAVLFHNGV